jgi:hypothetical protein
MKHLILIAIRLYWIAVPESKRRHCIFNESCSKYVYNETKAHGLIRGLKAFYFRFRNCRGEYHVINLRSDEVVVMLRDGSLVKETDLRKTITI